MKKILCLMAVFMICLSGWTGLLSVSAEGTGTDEYAAAFSGSGRLALVPYTPVDLPPEMTDPETPGLSPDGFLGLSPDGKAILWGALEEKEETVEPQPDETPEPETGTEKALSGRGRKKIENTQIKTVTTPVPHIGVIRDGETIEFRANAARGDGDPYEKLSKLMVYSRDLPAEEGLSWSADGRYVTFSDLKRARFSNQSLDVPVVDTADGEFWLADSYQKNILAEDGGIVYISRFSRAGDYVYYLVYRNGAYQFRRCTPEGGNREILWEQKNEDDPQFSLSSMSNLLEAADGSWILSGTTGTGQRKTDMIALIAFSPSGSRWTATVYPMLIPILLSATRVSASAASGYSVMTLLNLNSQQASMEAAVPSEQDLAISEIINRVNLLRVDTKNGFSWDVWCLRRTGGNNTDLEMVSASEYLQYVLLGVMGSLPDQYPEGFDARESLIHPNPAITNACLSPDGRYALLCVNTRERDESSRRMICLLYLLDMETMEIHPVEAPEGTVSETLWTNTAYGRVYRPGISWNPDGTIVLINGNSRIEFFRLTVEN